MKQQGMSSLCLRTEPLEDYYELKEELGRGNFAIVKKCQHKESNGEYAAKCITKKRTKASKRGMSKDAIENEASLLLSVDHAGIIKLYDVFETRQNITLVMELLTGGELFEEISKEEFILEKDACHYTKQILKAVGHLHERNIVHLDLKPENIVLKSKGQKEIKLVDFGLARKLEPGKELREMMGTPEFAAPEVVNYDIVSYYTDMWAIGVITYILLSGASPFLGDDDQETYQNITTCDYEFDEEYFSQITENAQEFIRKLLIKKASDRNTIDDCLKHPWIACEDLEDSVINTKKIRGFVARRRWKQSLKMVTMISRLKVLCRNSITSSTSDASGDESDSNYDNEAGDNERSLSKSFAEDRKEDVAVEGVNGADNKNMPVNAISTVSDPAKSTDEPSEDEGVFTNFDSSSMHEIEADPLNASASNTKDSIPSMQLETKPHFEEEGASEVFLDEDSKTPGDIVDVNCNVVKNNIEVDDFSKDIDSGQDKGTDDYDVIPRGMQGIASMQSAVVSDMTAVTTLPPAEQPICCREKFATVKLEKESDDDDDGDEYHPTIHVCSDFKGFRVVSCTTAKGSNADCEWFTESTPNEEDSCLQMAPSDEPSKFNSKANRASAQEEQIQYLTSNTDSDDEISNEKTPFTFRIASRSTSPFTAHLQTGTDSKNVVISSEKHHKEVDPTRKPESTFRLSSEGTPKASDVNDSEVELSSKAAVGSGTDGVVSFVVNLPTGTATALPMVSLPSSSTVAGCEQNLVLKTGEHVTVQLLKTMEM